jgi:predicted DNA-binding protein
MENTRLNYKKFYAKQLRTGILTLRLDPTEQDRLFKLSNVTRRNKSDLVRDALFDYFKKFDGII